MRRMLLTVALGATLLTAASGVAHAASARRAPAPPMRWPGSAAAAQSDTWLLGVRPGVSLQRLARRVHARAVGSSTLAVPAGRARAAGRSLARAGLLRYAEPDIRLRDASVADGTPEAWARGAVVRSSLVWPAPAPEVAIVDEMVDGTHPDLAGHVRFLDSADVTDSHGTMVASVIAGAANGGGVMGVVPGAPIAAYGTDLSCADIATGIERAARAGIRIVNLSFGSTQPCFTMYLATQRAFGVGTLVVAASGNEFANGNPVVWPAAFPHVLSVAAIGPGMQPAYFSSANLAVDLTAPGVGVPVAVPPAFDTADGAADGITTADGTSFAAPMVAGAASWVLAARPHLSAGQLGDVLRESATDVGDEGWDADTGWGLLHVEAALQIKAPPDDISEPNDEIGLVDGSVFRGADKPIWRGRGVRSLRAWVDAIKDRFDVYRVTLPRRSRTRIALAPAWGDADLRVYDQAARALDDVRLRVCRSLHRGRTAETCDVEWNGRRPRTIYVAIEGMLTRAETGAEYRLRLSRLR